MRTPALLLCLAAALLASIAPRDAHAVPPHRSWHRLTTGNGHGFATYDAEARRLTFLSNRPYVEHAPGDVTRDLAFDAYFGVRASGGASWLTERPVESAEYRDQTNVARVTQSYGPLRAETHVFAPWGLESPSVVLALRVTNASRAMVSDAAAYALLNFHLGSGAPEPGANGERITWDNATRSYSETGPSGLTLAYVPFGAGTIRHGASPENPFFTGRDGGTLVEVADTGTRDDAVAGFQWTFGPMAPGAEQWVGVVITLGGAAAARAWMGERDPRALVEREVNDWNAWRVAPPQGLRPEELRVWRMSETVLRMAQSREPPPSRGQILASLPPGIWWITWVRDMAYAVAALARSGHTAEAGLGVDFWRGGRVGEYRRYVGHEYHVSVVRYYGNGLEWSDSDENGPNVEFDGFGLAAWAARLAGRREMDVNADTLRRLVDSTGLIAPDSSIWEVHWNGRQKRYGYTSITAAQGLCVTGDATTARGIRDAMVRRMVLPTGGLAGNLEELERGQPARDAAIVEAINWGLIDPQGRLARDTINEFERLRTPVNRGYFRNDDGGGYDSQEWVFVDLRIASALRRMGRAQEADELLAWVTAQADANYGLHAELYHRENADYVGAVPMVGFGAGAYMLALMDRAQLEPVSSECFPPEHRGGGDGGVAGDGGTTGGGGGCAVRAAGSGASGSGGANGRGGWMVVAMAIALGWMSRKRGARGARLAAAGCTTARLAATARGTACTAGRLAPTARGTVFTAPAPHDGGRTTASAHSPVHAGSIPAEPGAEPVAHETRGDRSHGASAPHRGGRERARRDPRAVGARRPAVHAVAQAVTARRTAALAALAILLAALLAACGPGGAGDAGDGATDASVIPRDAPPSVQGLPVRDCTSRFAYPLGRQAGAVAVAGQWNDFSTTRDPMTDGLFTNVYRASVRLPPGSYGYKFVVDGRDWSLDPTNGMSYYVNGTENSRLDVPDCAVPELRVERADVSAERVIELDIQYVDATARAGLDRASVTVTMNRMPVAAGMVTVDEARARIAVRARVTENNKYTLRIAARDRMGRAAREVIVPMWVEDEPFEWSDGTMYFVFTDRFRNGNPANDAPLPGVDMRANYRGGDLAGVLAALREGYFDRLGVRSIWLSPVNANTNEPGRGGDGRMYSGYHGYWVTQPRAVEERFGTLEDLRAVTAEAHRRGIRVLFDVVNNQLHREHPYFTQHRDWFNGDGSCVCGGVNCDWDSRALDCWFTNYLPDVNYTNNAATDQMIEDALWWLVEADADGFRVDAVKHMQHVSSTTLRNRIRQTLEHGNARYYLVGETFTGADGRGLIQSFIGPNELWGQFDFPLFWSIVGIFAQNGGTMMDLDNAVREGERVYQGALMSPFLGNHDVERFISRAAGDLQGNTMDQAWNNPPGSPDRDEPYERLFLAFAFLLGQPGVPLIYYGDEVGTPGAADPDNRRMMRFGTDLNAREARLLQRVQVIARARGTHPGLRRGARRTLHTDGDGYVYARGAGENLAIVAINRGTTSRTVRVNVPANLGGEGMTLRDLLGGPSVTISGGGFDMPFTPRNAALYVR